MESSAKKYVSGRDHLDGLVEQSSQRICCDRSAIRADCWIWLIRSFFVRRSVKKPSCSARSRMAAEKRGIYFGRMLNLLVSTFRPRTERDFPSNDPQPIEITAFLRRIYFGRACHNPTLILIQWYRLEWDFFFAPQQVEKPLISKGLWVTNTR